MTENIKIIEAVLWDLGDTLVSLAPLREEIFIRSAYSIGIELSRANVRLAYRIVDFNNKYSSLKLSNSKDRDHFYHYYNQQICTALGISSHFSKLNPVLKKNFKTYTKWKLVKGSRFVLGKLSRYPIPLAIVANWNKNIISLTKKLGINKFFKSIIASENVGVEKPNPEIFYHTLAELSLSKGNGCILYIGNEYESDVIGARMAGLVPVLIDTSKNYLHADCIRFDSVLKWYDSLVISKEDTIMMRLT